MNATVTCKEVSSSWSSIARERYPRGSLLELGRSLVSFQAGRCCRGTSLKNKFALSFYWETPRKCVMEAKLTGRVTTYTHQLFECRRMNVQHRNVFVSFSQCHPKTRMKRQHGLQMGCSVTSDYDYFETTYTPLCLRPKRRHFGAMSPPQHNQCMVVARKWRQGRRGDTTLLCSTHTILVHIVRVIHTEAPPLPPFFF